MTTRFIHTADWHLGRPFASIQDAQKRSQLQRERIQAIERIAQAASSHVASFVVVCGDLFDSPTTEKSVVAMACAAIGTIPCPVYVIPGNHDHGGPGSIWEQPFFKRQREELCPNLEVMNAAKPFEREDAILLPCPLLRRHESMDTTAWIREWLARPDLGDEGKPRIILAHGSTQAFISGDTEDESPATNSIDVSRLDETGYDYLALGDWHGTKSVSAKAWFSGTPELDRFPKGGGHAPGQVLLVEVSRGEPPTVTPLATSRISWHRLAFTFAGESDLEEFQSRLRELLGPRAGEDLLELSLNGSLSLKCIQQVEEEIESLEARLLRLKLNNQVVVAPSEAEITELTQRTADPLVAQVATKLIGMVQSGNDQADIARQALRELHSRLNAQPADRR